MVKGDDTRTDWRPHVIPRGWIEMRRPETTVSWRSMRLRVGLALLPGLAFATVFLYRSSWLSDGERRFTLFEDAMISMAYARTFALGGELTWYPGAPRVEGITNPLWTFIMSALHVIGLDGSTISLIIMLVGLVSLVSAAVLAAWLCHHLNPASSFAPATTAFVVAMTYPFVFWSLRGMEVGFLLAIALACIVSATRWNETPQPRSRQRLLASTVILILIGLMTRIDFIGIAIVIAGWMVWQAQPGAERRRVSAILGVAVLGLLGAMTVARLVYYGELVPNTFTLKVSGASFFTRIARGVRTDLKLLPLLLLAGVGAYLLWRRPPRATERPNLVLVVLAGLVTVAYSTGVGGDAWETTPNRYVTLFVACATIIAVSGLATTVSRLRIHSPLAVMVTVTLALVSGLALGFSDRFHWNLAGFGVAGMAVIVATYLAVQWIPGANPLRTLLLIGLVVFTLLFSSSGVGMVQWLREKQWIRSDQHMTEIGLALGRLTDPTARIAAFAAGAQIYYSDRPGIDLLGKSDAHIARGPIRGPFYPGHNKWDYHYSILELRPDVVAGLWHATPDDIADIENGGYAPYCMPVGKWTSKIFVRSDSTLVHTAMLQPAHRGSCPLPVPFP